MKKKSLIIAIITMFVLPFTVFAATSSVKTLDAVSTDTGIRFNGTTDSGILAVSCSLYDKDDNDLDFVSVQVEDNKFDGKFTVANGKYTIKCANYEGGAILEKKIQVNASTTAPATGDNIILYVLLFGISLTAIVITKNKINE